MEDIYQTLDDIKTFDRGASYLQMAPPLSTQKADGVLVVQESCGTQTWWKRWSCRT